MATTPDIPNTNRIADYTASLGQTDFVIPWIVIAESLDAAVDDFKVDVNGAEIDLSSATFVGNVVTGESGIWNGGTLTIPARAAADRVVIYSDRRPRRTSHFLEGRSLPFTTLDQLMDDVAIQMRDLDLRLDRALLLTPEQFLDGGSVDDIATQVHTDAVNAVAAAAGVAADAAAAASSATAAGSSASAASTSATTAASAAVAAANGIRNIFSLFTAGEIAIIQAGSNTTDLTTKINTAMAAHPNSSWYWPAGFYFINNTISVPAGITWMGAGIGVTTVILGGSPWGVEQLNPNGTNQVKGFSVMDMSLLISNNGIRLNSTTGGYDDTSGTQYYISQPFWHRVSVAFNGPPSNKTLLQWNKTFNGSIRDCNFNGGNVQLDLQGCDINTVRDNRFDLASDCAIQDYSHGTFGSTNDIRHNDMNNPKNCFYRGCNRDGKILDNHMELDFSPGSTGSGGNMPAAIDIVAGNAFQTVITGNRMDVGAFCDHWLRYASSNPYSLIVENNGTSGPNAATPSIGILPYWTNSSTRMICKHSGNHLGENAFPMNYESLDIIPGSIDELARVTASRPGVALTGIGAALTCANGAFKLPPDSNTGHYLEISDWGALGFPANTLIGSLTSVFTTYADAAGQVLNWQILDNGVSIATGTITHTNANQFYYSSPAGAAAVAIATKLQIRLWNADTVRNGTVYVQSVGVRA